MPSFSILAAAYPLLVSDALVVTTLLRCQRPYKVNTRDIFGLRNSLKYQASKDA